MPDGIGRPLRCSTSLWSADLADLAGAIGRVGPHSDRFHLDVADGHRVPALLFFPDLVAAIRRRTAIPLEVHLMVTDPVAWVGPFADAGADRVLFCLDTLGDDPDRAFRAARDRDLSVGVSLTIAEPVEAIRPWLDRIDLLALFGTEVGIKGASPDPATPAKVATARAAIDATGRPIDLMVDGGIRRESVPALRQAGADWIVPGSLMFGGDPAELRRWLAGL